MSTVDMSRQYVMGKQQAVVDRHKAMMTAAHCYWQVQIVSSDNCCGHGSNNKVMVTNVEVRLIITQQAAMGWHMQGDRKAMTDKCIEDPSIT